MLYEPVIGLEVHAQLLTKSKMFCSCRADYSGSAPNSLVCPVCLGMPGTLPVVNKQAVEFAIMTALALNCTVQETNVFSRKSYFYPDLPKNYQISQYDLPLSRNGWLMAETKNGETRIGVTRVHLEEDTAKLTHVEAGGETYSLIDFNRSGMPLMEIVSDPDMHSIDEVNGYITKLRAILRYLGVSSGDMEKGAMRFEANISLRPAGSTTLGNRCEVKNLNSFRAVLRSCEYEINRQTAILERGERVEQQTMGWDDLRNVTVTQRSKEEAHDYRYFPEPDIPPLVIAPEWVERVRRVLPELPDAKRQRFMSAFGLSAYDAGLLVAEQEVAAYFEACVAGRPQRAKPVANWILGELFRLMKESGQEIDKVMVQPAAINELIDLVEAGTITMAIAKDVFTEMFAGGKKPGAIVAARGLTQINDSSAIDAAISKAIQSNPQAVADYRGGKETAIRFLVGQVMKETKGRANPTVITQMLVEKLK